MTDGFALYLLTIKVMGKVLLATTLLFWMANLASAGEVEVVRTVFRQNHATWRVDATLRHADAGWQHYANAWRIVDGAGAIIATRELAHPHTNEQPFTRSLDDVAIPDDLHIVFIEARDNIHGWSSQRLRVNLRVPKGNRYEIHLTR